MGNFEGNIIERAGKPWAERGPVVKTIKVVKVKIL